MLLIEQHHQTLVITLAVTPPLSLRAMLLRELIRELETIDPRLWQQRTTLLSERDNEMKRQLTQQEAKHAAHRKVVCSQLYSFR